MKAPMKMLRWLTFRKADRFPWWLRLVKPVLFPTLHYCCEWDGLVIDKHCYEFRYCTCYDAKGGTP